MPLHDFYCRSCGAEKVDVYRSVEIGAAAHPPHCSCGEVMTPIIAIGGMGTGFTTFDVDVDGKKTTIDSLHTLRRVERESEQRYRNGEGEPLRFRAYQQDRSNMDVSSFGDAGTIGERTYSSGQQPLKKSGKISTKRHGSEKPQIKVARHAGQSALKG